MSNYEVVLRSMRGDNLDCCYYGSIYLSKNGEIVKYLGLEPNVEFFMRSLAKPFQASTLFDYNIVDDINILPNELAIISGSHAGSPNHIKVLKKLISKYQIRLSDIDLISSEPLDKRRYLGRKTKLQNNCSGKHIMMLVLSKYLGYPLKDYTNPNHPVQKLILNKQIELTGYSSKNVSFDGCGTPLWAASADGIIKGYYNLLTDKKYSYLINSILKYPDIYGGFNRLDSDIIKLSGSRLFSKVGANGFIIVYNLSTNESVLIKLAQNNNPIRKLVTYDILKKLHWLDVPVEQYEYNQKNQKVAKYYYEFEV